MRVNSCTLIKIAIFFSPLLKLLKIFLSVFSTLLFPLKLCTSRLPIHYTNSSNHAFPCTQKSIGSTTSVTYCQTTQYTLAVEVNNSTYNNPNPQQMLDQHRCILIDSFQLLTKILPNLLCFLIKDDVIFTTLVIIRQELKKTFSGVQFVWDTFPYPPFPRTLRSSKSWGPTFSSPGLTVFSVISTVSMPSSHLKIIPLITISHTH